MGKGTSREVGGVSQPFLARLLLCHFLALSRLLSGGQQLCPRCTRDLHQLGCRQRGGAGSGREPSVGGQAETPETGAQAAKMDYNVVRGWGLGEQQSPGLVLTEFLLKDYKYSL